MEKAFNRELSETALPLYKESIKKILIITVGASNCNLFRPNKML